MGMFDIDAPRATEDLTASLAGQHEEISSFFSSLAEEEFLAPQGSHWSPADHLRHLVKCVQPLAGALEIPKVILRVRFGRWREGSRSYDEVVEAYREQLAAGADAGPFAPSQRGGLRDAAWRLHILNRWEATGDHLTSSLGSWSEAALDRYRLPHPLLGRLTVREMLYFTLYHNAHHARRVDERRAMREGGES